MGWLWKHCDKCNAELGHPTDADKIIGSTKCPDCGHEQEIDIDIRRWAIEEILETLKAQKS